MINNSKFSENQAVWGGAFQEFLETISLVENSYFENCVGVFIIYTTKLTKLVLKNTTFFRTYS